MQYARFRVAGRVRYGMVEGEVLHELGGSPLRRAERTGKQFRLQEVRLLPPVQPKKLLAVALNYRSHIGERQHPAKPELFLKAPTALIGPEEPIILPPDSNRVDAEGELVVIIGRRARHVSPAEALDYVAGYTCGNDVSARDWQRNDLQWWRAKSADTFAPLGPFWVTDVDPRELLLETRVNGEVKQQASTGDLIFDVPTIISLASQAMTLEPGDVIYTGTPGITPTLSPGDVVEVEIKGIGVLRNPVVAHR
jgi:2-keto-4-pentenoate hydratase/2-oxohepta-3-ene-1,7-dioic acid hydratase in catechol pathway